MSITTVVLESTDPAATEAFLDKAFGLGDRIAVRPAEAPSTGFRGFALSLVVSQPGTVDSLLATALEAGATTVKPAAKSLWGYGCSLRDPEGNVWQIATSKKKDTGPATREIDDIVLLIGGEDVAVAKRFYVDRGLAVAKAYGRKYVEFEAAEGEIKLALYKRGGLAKVAGVDPEGSGSHRIAVRGAGSFTDPDGYVWEA
jgi:hypothetical protein